MSTVVGVPKEIKDQEGRVSMQPGGVVELVHHGHEVIVESGAGKGSGFSDEEYEKAGAKVVGGPEELFASSELIRSRSPSPRSTSATRRGTSSSPTSTWLPTRVSRVPDGAQDQRNSLRDRRASRREPAASGPDERGSGEDGGTGSGTSILSAATRLDARLP